MVACHDVSIIMRSLHRIFRQNDLKCKNKIECSRTIVLTIVNELKRRSFLFCYRTMHQLLNSCGISANRETVRIAIKSIDPQGVALRRKHRLTRRKYFNKGPNFLWHLDGNDKLRPFGLSISATVEKYYGLKWVHQIKTRKLLQSFSSMYFRL